MNHVARLRIARSVGGRIHQHDVASLKRGRGQVELLRGGHACQQSSGGIIDDDHQHEHRHAGIDQPLAEIEDRVATMSMIDAAWSDIARPKSNQPSAVPMKSRPDNKSRR